MALEHRQDYDPVKAHEYYIKMRQLKDRPDFSPVKKVKPRQRPDVGSNRVPQVQTRQRPDFAPVKKVQPKTVNDVKKDNRSTIDKGMSWLQKKFGNLVSVKYMGPTPKIGNLAKIKYTGPKELKIGNLVTIKRDNTPKKTAPKPAPKVTTRQRPDFEARKSAKQPAGQAWQKGRSAINYGVRAGATDKATIDSINKSWALTNKALDDIRKTPGYKADQAVKNGIAKGKSWLKSMFKTKTTVRSTTVRTDPSRKVTVGGMTFNSPEAAGKYLAAKFLREEKARRNR